MDREWHLGMNHAQLLQSLHRTYCIEVLCGRCAGRVMSLNGHPLEGVTVLVCFAIHILHPLL